MQKQIQKIGPYEITETLSIGGMGIVYYGRHEGSGEQAAVKTIFVQDQKHIQRIRHEILTLSQMDHPGIVTIKDQGIHQGNPWYAMEVIEGQSLTNYLDVTMPNRHQPMKDLRTQQYTKKQLLKLLTIIRRLCYPLAYLHGEGIVHSDLKPDNIMIKEDGRPVLIDFGLISHFNYETSRERMTIAKESVGTPTYMSPEQIMKSDIDARTDLYALGCILYEIVSGSPPFIASSSYDILTAHLEEPPPNLRQKYPHAPPQLVQLIEDLLKKDPQDRIGYVDVVASKLERIGAENGSHRGVPKPKTYIFPPRHSGRENVLSKLVTSIKKLDHKQGSCIFISGESGIGKTRLLIEFTKRIPVTCSVSIGACMETSGRPLEALRKPLQKIADICKEQGKTFSDKILGKRGNVLSVFEPSLRDVPGQDCFPEATPLSLEASRLRLYSYLTSTLVALSREMNVILLLDDLQ